MRFSAVVVLAACAASGFATTVADVNADMIAIIGQTIALDNSITSFSVIGGLPTQVVAIGNNLETLGKLFHKCADDVKQLFALPTEAESHIVVTSFKAFEPIMISALKGCVAKEATLSRLGFKPNDDLWNGLTALFLLESGFGHIDTGNLESAFHSTLAAYGAW